MSGESWMRHFTALHQLTDALFHNMASAVIAPRFKIMWLYISEAGNQSSVVSHFLHWKVLLQYLKISIPCSSYHPEFNICILCGGIYPTYATVL